MKKVVLVSAMIFLLATCRPDEFKDIGPAYSTTEGIDGSWQIFSVEVVDQTIPGTDVKDLSAFYTSQPALMQMEFSSDDNTYSVTNSVPGAPFGSGGRYAFNDPEFPSQIYLIPAGADTLTLNMASMVRPIDPFLTISKPTIGCDQPFALYNFTFKRN